MTRYFCPPARQMYIMLMAYSFRFKVIDHLPFEHFQFQFINWILISRLFFFCTEINILFGIDQKPNEPNRTKPFDRRLQFPCNFQIFVLHSVLNGQWHGASVSVGNMQIIGINEKIFQINRLKNIFGSVYAQKKTQRIS